ncbi:MAG: XdhC family protein [Deltaproteobacteria bacterium]|nr:XdhC family protein [Deltaproteobacteria bacterium]
MTDQELFEKLSELRARGKPACLATIVEAVGSTPRDVGAKMLVCADGSMFGSVGGGCGESQVRTAALRCLLSTGRPEMIEVDLTDELGTRGGDVCGGKLKIFVEPVSGEEPAR